MTRKRDWETGLRPIQQNVHTIFSLTMFVQFLILINIIHILLLITPLSNKVKIIIDDRMKFRIFQQFDTII